MKGETAASDKNIARRIRKHIHAQTHTIECLVPAGFGELGKRTALKILENQPETGANGSCPAKIRNGRVRIEEVPFDAIHCLLAEGEIFSEIGLRILRTRCTNETKLMQVLQETEWDLWLPDSAASNFNIRVLSQSSQMYHEARIKRLLQEYFRKIFPARGQEHDCAAADKTVELDVILERDVLEIFVCISGRDFWKRGHKAGLRHAAPLREDIAACLVRRLAELSGSKLGLDRPRLVLNPFCGTGTLLHEAALFSWRCGRLLNSRYELPYMSLPFFKKQAFEHVLRTKKSRIVNQEEAFRTTFIGEDLDKSLCRNTQEWFEQSSLNLSMKFLYETKITDSCAVDSGLVQVKEGEGVWIFANPPFGVRLAARSQGGPEEIYKLFALRIKNIFDSCYKNKISACAVVLCPDEKTWKKVRQICKDFHQECEHFSLGGLDIRAVFIMTGPFAGILPR